MTRINSLRVSLAALACGLVAVALGVVILVRDADEAAPGASPTVPVTETSSPGAGEATEPAQYRAIRVVGDLPWPSDLTVLTTTGGYGHGTGTPWRTRLIVGSASGPKVTEMTPPGDATATLMGVLADQESGALYATVCSGEQCSYEGSIPGLASTFYRSKDGGFRWIEINRREGRWWPRLAVEGDFVVFNFDGAAPATVYAISNKALNRPEAYAGLVRYRGEPAWISRDLPMLVRDDGSSLLKFDALPIEAKVTDFASDETGSRSLIEWTVSTPNPTSHGFDSRYFATAIDGSSVTTFESRIQLGRISRPWDDGKWLVDAEVAMRPNTCTQDYARDGDHGLSPVVFDPATGDLAFLGAPYFPQGCAEGAETVVQTWTGAAAKVVTPGDCLNMRASPGAAAKIVDCLPDGAVVLRKGPITEDGGVRWVWITTLGNEPGWVAEPFLSPP